MTQGDDTESGSSWRTQTGVASDTVRVPIVCKKHHREQWDQEVEEEGFRNRSRYLFNLIQEARAYRRNDVRGTRASEQRIQQLQSEVERLEEELEHERRKTSGRPSVDDVDFLERFLTENYQPLSEILQAIVESGALNDLIRKRVEDKLYFLAQQDRVEFQRGWGWRLVEDGGDA